MKDVLHGILAQLRNLIHQFKAISNEEVPDYLLLAEIGGELKAFEQHRGALLNSYNFSLGSVLQSCASTILPQQDLKSLSLCNKYIFTLLSPILSFRHTTGLQYACYSPLTLKCYDRELVNVPKSVQRLHLALGCKISTELPQSITHLSFTQKPSTEFPQFSTQLSLEQDIALFTDAARRESLQCPLPSSLTHLTISAEFDTDLLSLKYLPPLPSSLTYLKLRAIDSLPDITQLSNLKELRISARFHDKTLVSLPPSLQHLKIKNFKHTFTLNTLPSTLRVLSVQGCQVPITKLPPHIARLKFERFNRAVENLPPSLTHLSLGNEFNQPINTLPSSLTHLSLGDKFAHSIDCLPPSLTHLTFGASFDSPVAPPPSLVYLKFSDRFNAEVSNIPKTLRQLHFGTGFKFLASLPVLPDLTHLTIGNCEFDHLDTRTPSLKYLDIGSYQDNITSPPEKIRLPPQLSRFSYSTTPGKEVVQQIELPKTITQFTVILGKTEAHIVSFDFTTYELSVVQPKKW